MPSLEKTAYLVKPDSTFNKEIFVELNNNDKSVLEIKDKKIQGNWTMIYNEGFDIQAENYSFFTFSKYSPDRVNLDRVNLFKKVWKSKCYSTLVGFYHKGDNHWGCFYAEKIGENPDLITNNDVENKLHVVEGKVQPLLKMNFKEENVFGNINFLQSKEKETLVLNSKFKDHAKVVERINSMKDGLWEAANYQEYDNLTIEELNDRAGKKRHSHSNKSLFSDFKRNRASKRIKSLFDVSIMNSVKNSNNEK